MCQVYAQADPILYESRTRSVRIHGVLTTIKFENLFWQVLTEMAVQQQTTTNGLIVKLHDEVTQYRENVGNFASFLRVCCLRYMSLQAGRQLEDTRAQLARPCAPFPDPRRHSLGPSTSARANAKSAMTGRHEHRLERDGAVATLTLERPAAYNALTSRLLRSLLVSLREAADDPAVRALVVTGAGNGFCAGQALDDRETIDAAGRADLHRAVTEGFNPVVATLLTMEKPVVAAVNGPAAGAGFGIALACDFRIVAESASFVTAFAKIGLVPDSGVSLLLPRIVGYARALELCMLSDKVGARDARALGLATEVVPFGEVVPRAQAFAARLAEGPRALGLIKRELARNALGDIAQALATEAELQGIAGETADASEGLRAFGEKRKPRFTGR